MPCDDHLYTGFLDIQYLGMIIKLSIEKNTINRLFQISSSDVMTLHSFAKTYAELFSDSKTSIQKSRYRFPVSEGTAVNYDGGDIYYTMDITNIEGFLNLQLPSIEESLRYSFKKMGGKEEKREKDQRQSSSSDIKFI